jgi:predicted CXXCH cytochrome family protein
VCATCHADQVAGPTKKYPHAAVEAANCTTCHSAHSSPYGMLLKMDEKQLCKQCHEDIAGDAKLAKHFPAESGLCGSCHDVHGSDTKSFVKKTDAGLCLDCHKTFVAERDSSTTQHKGAGDCLVCHAPHEGKTQAILRKDTQELCGSCHQVDPTALTAKSTHSPYMQRDCATCHLPHFSKTLHLIRDDSNKLCLDCHPPTAMQIKMPTAHAPAVDDCKTCHSPHYSTSVALLKTPEKELCLSCHDAESIKSNASIVHTPVGDGDCTGCHSPHGSVEPKLLTGRATKIVENGIPTLRMPVLTDRKSDLCFTCHETLQQKFREGTTHQPVAEGKCDACHDAHGSEFVGHIKDAPAKVCASCHALDKTLTDKHDGYDLASANCVDCHNPHSSKKPKLLREHSHPPFEEKSCDNCHSKGPDGKVTLVAAINEICQGCHEDLALNVLAAIMCMLRISNTCSKLTEMRCASHATPISRN